MDVPKSPIRLQCRVRENTAFGALHFTHFIAIELNGKLINRKHYDKNIFSIFNNIIVLFNKYFLSVRLYVCLCLRGNLEIY